MSSSIKFGGIELPVFDHRDVLSTEDEYIAATKGLRTEFIRTAELGDNDGRPLSERIAYAERSFSAIEQLCGAKVVEHTWGFARDTGDHAYWRDETTRSLLLPKGYLLVVEVDVIVPEDQYTFNEQTARDVYIRGTHLIADLQHDPADPEMLQYVDYTSRQQTTYGRRAVEPESVPRLWYTDLDPIVWVETDHI